jgi:hypothetical protein
MGARWKARLAAGLVLILFGAWLLFVQFLPGDWRERLFSWPLIVLAVGIFFLLLGLLSNEPGLAVPACIIGGIGGILYYQRIAWDFRSWTYAWALIPSFVGVGLILADVFSDRPWHTVRAGGWLILIGLALFFTFGSLLGLLPWPILPVLLIVIGALILLRPLFWRR